MEKAIFGERWSYCTNLEKEFYRASANKPIGGRYYSTSTLTAASEKETTNDIMLESLGFFRSATASDGKKSDQSRAYEERQSLLLSSDGDAAEAATTTTHRRVPSAPTSGDSTASASNNTTGMNPQDDLEQAPTGDSVDDILPTSALSNTSIADPLLSTAAAAVSASSLIPTEEGPQSLIQERGRGKSTIIKRKSGTGRRRRKRRTRSSSSHSEKTNKSSTPSGPLDALCTMCLRALCLDRTMLRNTYGCMNVIAKMTVWTSVLALAAAVVWYSYEFAKNGCVCRLHTKAFLGLFCFQKMKLTHFCLLPSPLEHLMI